MAPTRKHISLSISEKVELIKDHDRGVSLKNLSEKYNVGVSTVHDIYKKKQDILGKYNKCENKTITKTLKKVSKPQHINLDTVLFEWFKVRRSEGVVITDFLIKAEMKVIYSLHCLLFFTKFIKE